MTRNHDIITAADIAAKGDKCIAMHSTLTRENGWDCGRDATHVLVQTRKSGKVVRIPCCKQAVR